MVNCDQEEDTEFSMRIYLKQNLLLPFMMHRTLQHRSFQNEPNIQLKPFKARKTNLNEVY
uniref:Uncharacterized protein n=1 Tax=Romanomermis culicivorax TaxID=13658 RepID=A0A915IVL9_ROMCU